MTERTFTITEGACYGQDVNTFFPVGKGGRRAKDGSGPLSTAELEQQVIDQYCSVCPVKDQCLELALFYDSTMDGLAVDGVWGGTTKLQRATINRKRVAAVKRARKIAA